MSSDLQLLIFHDSLDLIGGGEKVVPPIAKAFDAPIAAANVDQNSFEKLASSTRISTYVVKGIEKEDIMLIKSTAQVSS